MCVVYLLGSVVMLSLNEEYPPALQHKQNVRKYIFVICNSSVSVLYGMYIG